MTRMKFDEMMEHRTKLDSFPPCAALSYVVLAVKHMIAHDDYSFPNFRTLSNAVWTLRWAVKMLITRSLRA